MKFNAKSRQRLIDEYLAASGENTFVPARFVDWLEGQPEHPLYKAFFGKGDAHAAREYRISLARGFASGLRVTVSETVTDEKTVIAVVSREYPAFVSAVAHRAGGGGYQPFDANDDGMRKELRQQAATALRSWLSRYRGVVEHSGIDLSDVEAVAAALDARDAAAA